MSHTARKGCGGRRRRAFTLIEALFAMGLLVAVGVIFSATYPLASRMQAAARYRAQAVRIARREMEALRQVGFDKLSATPVLLTATPPVLDPTTPSTRTCTSATPCTFGALNGEGGDAGAQALPGGQMDFWFDEADLTNPSNNNADAAKPQTGLRRLTVRVRWTEYTKARTVTLVSLVANTVRIN